MLAHMGGILEADNRPSLHMPAEKACNTPYVSSAAAANGAHLHKMEMNYGVFMILWGPMTRNRIPPLIFSKVNR